MGIFRSEDMTLYQITVPKDDAWDIMNQLGALDMAHFINLNRGEQPFNLPYASQIKRCEETERRLLYILNQCSSMKVKINKPKDIESFLNALGDVRTQKRKAANLLFEEIEHDIIEKEKFVLEQTEKQRQIIDSYLTMLDYEKVLKAVEIVLPRIHGGQDVRATMHGGLNINDGNTIRHSLNDDEHNQPLLGTDESVYIAHVAGTIDALEKERLKKLLFRATRGKALTYFSDFEVKNAAGITQQKSVYIVVFQDGRMIRERIVRICDSFLGQRFDLPPLAQIKEKIIEIRRNIDESRNITETSKRYLKNYLQQINQISNPQHRDQSDRDEDNVSALEVYKWFVTKEKAIYTTLNYMKQGKATYIGYFWSPTKEEEKIRYALNSYPTTDFKRFENHTIKPPTYIKSNDFTMVYQEIVNTYGIPMHKEINPAVFAIVTFPFLFGVMFGDVGHGFLLLVTGMILCCLNSKLKKNPGMEGFLMMRYILLMMGFFAMFNGLIYNEFFAIPLQIFGDSCYGGEVMVLSVKDVPLFQNENITIPAHTGLNTWGYSRPGQPNSCVYPFGLDPKWPLSDQFLSYTNNFKMKLAVIFAIIQMSMGIIMKGLNALHFRNRLDFLFEFIPQFLLLFVLFGWMDILIIGKWLEPKNIEGLYDVKSTIPTEIADYNTVHLSPPIISTMIDIFLKFGDNAKLDGTPGVQYNYVIGGQRPISIIFLVIALISVPVMLYVKPMVLKRRLQNSHNVEVHTEKIHYQIILKISVILHQFKDQPVRVD